MNSALKPDEADYKIKASLSLTAHHTTLTSAYRFHPVLFLLIFLMIPHVMSSVPSPVANIKRV